MLKTEPRWRYESDPAGTAPTVCGDALCFVTRTGWLHGVGPDGAGRFRVELGEVTAQPAAKGGVLLLPERGGDLHAFSLETFNVLWSYDMEGPLWASPVVWGTLVYSASWAGVTMPPSHGPQLIEIT